MSRPGIEPWLAIGEHSNHYANGLVVLLFNPLLGDKAVHAFPKGISLKVNIIAQLEFELTHYDVAVHHWGIRGFMPFPRVLVQKWM